MLLFKLEIAQSHFGCALCGCDRAEVKTTHACCSLRLHRPMYSDSPILMPPATAPVIPASSTCAGTTSLRSAKWNKSNRSRRKRAPHCGHLCRFDATATDTKQQEKHGHKAVVKAENHVTKVQPSFTAGVGEIGKCIKKPKAMQQWQRTCAAGTEQNPRVLLQHNFRSAHLHRGICWPVERHRWVRRC